jgi:hypothetical protein
MEQRQQPGTHRLRPERRELHRQPGHQSIRVAAGLLPASIEQPGRGQSPVELPVDLQRRTDRAEVRRHAQHPGDQRPPGYNLVYLSFTDWSQAGSATQFYLDQSAIGTGYRAAPRTFYSGVPPIITQNIGSGFWVDMWVICDSANCYLFSSDDNGHLYRSQTSVANFPNGMSQPAIAIQDANKNNLFEASNVYKVAGNNQYLLIVEAIGSDGRRYFRSWTSSSIAGTWNPLAASESNPFARASNVTFSGTAWTRDISHGEMIRAGVDQTLTISPCHMRYVYQGRDPNATGSYNSLPWRLGLLTQSGSTC